MKDLIFHTPHNAINQFDSKTLIRKKRRRATFVLRVNKDKVKVFCGICNPKDNFQKSEGRSEAFTGNAGIDDIKYPKEIKTVDMRRNFALLIGKSLVKSFVKNPSRYVQRKIENNKVTA